MAKCKYYKKMRKNGYNRCIRDNSIRKGCHCAFYELSMWSRFKIWLFGR